MVTIILLRLRIEPVQTHRFEASVWHSTSANLLYSNEGAGIYVPAGGKPGM